MSDDPIQLRASAWVRGKGIIKLKRGGNAKTSNSGGAGRSKRTRTPGIALRDKNGKHLPWPAQGPII